MQRLIAIAILACLAASGCGTTRWTDTKRTATEQLLISDAIDRAVSHIDVRPLAGEKVFLDAQFLKGTVDENYTTSVLRQHMLASGCRLTDKKEDAEYIVEARAGAVGTSRHDLLYGIPSTDLSSLAPVPGVPSRIPEIPLAKKTEQQGAAKIAVFAYHRETGLPYWQSGNAQIASTAKDIWVLGVGPFERGTIREETKFAGDDIGLKRWARSERDEHATVDGKVWVAESMQFHTPESIQYARRRVGAIRQAKVPEKPQPPVASPAPPAPGGAAPAPQTPPPPPLGAATPAGPPPLGSALPNAPVAQPPRPAGASSATASRATIQGVRVQ